VSEPLFSPQELGRLDRLRLRRRRSVRGEALGEWRSARLGAGSQFADHRAYVVGDDLRTVDWNVYGRLGDLVVKRFETEESLNLLLCVDRSLSMSGRKSATARRVAGALGYVALSHMDYVRLAWLPPPQGAAPTLHRGRGRAAMLLDELAALPDQGATDHLGALQRAVGTTRHRGLAVVVSDFFDPAGAVRGLGLLRSRGLDVAAVHVIDAKDAELPDAAALVAVDRETGEELALDVTRELADRVAAAWRRRAEGIERWCLSREIAYHRVDAGRPLWDALGPLVVGPAAVGA
jgi:uncharacterized protein (DUF58 family)